MRSIMTLIHKTQTAIRRNETLSTRTILIWMKVPHDIVIFEKRYNRDIIKNDIIYAQNSQFIIFWMRGA